MHDLRAQPKDLCMSDSMPFMQNWQYRTTHSVDELLHDQFFLPVRSMLRAGDSVTLCRFDVLDDRVAKLLEAVTVRVIASGAEARAVPLLRTGETLRVQVSAEGYAVKRGFAGKWRVVNGDEVISEHPSKDEAEQALTALSADRKAA